MWVKNEEIRGHKQIISARNDIFAKMFTCDMVEKISGRVEITDIEAKIFKLVLRYIYSGKFESKDDADELLKVMVAADKYFVKNLVDTCARRLWTNLTVENVPEILEIADRVGVDFLKVECTKFMKKNETKQIVT